MADETTMASNTGARNIVNFYEDHISQPASMAKVRYKKKSTGRKIIRIQSPKEGETPRQMQQIEKLLPGGGKGGFQDMPYNSLNVLQMHQRKLKTMHKSIEPSEVASSIKVKKFSKPVRHYLELRSQAIRLAS